MQKEAEQQGWKVGDIEPEAPSAEPAVDDSDAEKESPYW